MVNYVLNIRFDRDSNRRMVRYLMRQKAANVINWMPFETAVEMLKQGTAHVSDLYQDFPITADDVYYFDAMVDRGMGETVRIGADGLPIPAGDGRPVRRIKDIVCE